MHDEMPRSEERRSAYGHVRYRRDGSNGVHIYLAGVDISIYARGGN
jgi:hypothetical protein